MTSPRLCYQTVEFGNIDIHLCTLRDKQEFHDPDGIAEQLGISSATWSLFGVVWPSSLVLAHFMSDVNTSSKRILEVGCGIGLSSILLNKRNDDITATDYHPETQKFLDRNTRLNNDPDISFEQVDWSADTNNLGLFDMIIGSDLLYEDDHIKLLGNFINQHARPECEVILVDPGRGRKNKLASMLMDFGFSSSVEKPRHTRFLETEFKGHILKFARHAML